MLLAGAVAAALVIGVYWLRRGSAGGPRLQESMRLPVLLLAGLIILMISDRVGRQPTSDTQPIFVALAVDLSWSMGAAPGPGSELGTRMQRARQTLLEVLDTLDASGNRVMVSVVGFTVSAQPILVWDNNLAQVKEVVQHVIAPGLLSKPGSDLGRALNGVLPLFDNLPTSYRSPSTARFLIVVSDGEQTEEAADVTVELAELRTRGISVVALQVGSLDEPEGLPLHDEQGEFTGFQDVGGEFYTTPDPETMSLIAGSDPGMGRHVRAEGADAAGEISEFIGVHRQSNMDQLRLGLSLTVWGLAVLLLLWFI